MSLLLMSNFCMVYNLNKNISLKNLNDNYINMTLYEIQFLKISIYVLNRENNKIMMNHKRKDLKCLVALPMA